MKIDRLSLKNFLMFTGKKEIQCDDSFNEGFISGINVFIGENATGKTTLLKCIYAACEYSNEKANPNKVKKFSDYFSASKDAVKESSELISVYSSDAEFHRKWDTIMLGVDKWNSLNIKSVLIPTAEMLSHSKGLLAMASKYDGIPFDHTQIDILVNAQLWVTREITARNKKILEIIGSVIGGEVIYENDTFYIVKSNGLRVEFSFEADGFKKLGLLWKLIRNGLLESGSILLWDEPEASINPELIPLLVDILYMLKNDGVQIFIATHNYTLAKYIDIKKQNPDDTLFISLYKDKEGTIKTARSDNYSELKNNPIETSEERLYEAIIEKSLEEAE